MQSEAISTQVQAEAAFMKKYQVQRDWRQSLCALITDGRVVLGCSIHPEHNGHSMTATGHYTLAGPDGKVDPQSAGFLEVLYFVWGSEVNHCPQLSRTRPAKSSVLDKLQGML